MVHIFVVDAEKALLDADEDLEAREKEREADEALDNVLGAALLHLVDLRADKLSSDSEGTSQSECI